MDPGVENTLEAQAYSVGEQVLAEQRYNNTVFGPYYFDKKTDILKDIRLSMRFCWFSR